MPLATDNNIALNYNWNGIVQPAEVGLPDAGSGFRSIADRALYVDGFGTNTFGSTPIAGITGISYTVSMTPNVPDIIHLGNTIVFTPTTATQNPPAGSPTRWWDGSGNPGLRRTTASSPTG